MANRTDRTQFDFAPAGSPPQPLPPRQGLGGIDAVVLMAMAAASVAVGVALHLQAEIGTVLSATLAGAVFALLALVHTQKRRLDRLRQSELPAVRQEPALQNLDASEAALDIASSQLAAAAAALRDSDSATRRQRRAAPTVTANEPETPELIADHGWGEPGAVEALVRQYARDLDRSTAPAGRPNFGTQPKPNLPMAPTTESENAPQPAAQIESANAEVIRKAAAGEVEIHLQPIVALADRKARLYEVFPRVIDTVGRMLTQDDYGPEAESMGLALAIERAALLRCCTIQRKLSERGRARAMIFRLSSAAIRDRAYLQRLIGDINPDPLLSDLIIFEIDQREIEQGDGVERDNMEFLAKAGFRFSLGSAETLALELQELTVRRIGFVRVTPSVLNTEQNPAAVSDLRVGGIETILTAIVRDEDARVGRAFGLVLGQGALFSEPKPLRPDVTASVAPAAPKRTGRTRAA